MKLRTLVGMFVALSLVVVACSDSVADSAENLCSSLEALHGTMEQIAGADVSVDTTTVGDIQSAAEEAESAVQDVQDAESDLSDSLKAQLRDDLEELQSSIEGISANSTLAEAGQDVASALVTFKQSWDQTLNELNCSTDS